MKLFAIILLSATLLSCGTTKNNNDSEVKTSDTTVTSKPERNIMIKAEIGRFVESAPFNITDVRREGNTLFVNVNFTGGCGEHYFKVIGNPAIMKSMPAKRSVMIAHDVPREICEDMVSKVLEIDISALAESQTPGSQIILLLDGWEKEINYIFE